MKEAICRRGIMGTALISRKNWQAIRRNEKHHEGWYGATSSFTGVLGRMATYSGQVVRWDEAVAKGPSELPEKFDLAAPPRVLPDAKGNYAAAVPGATKPY